MTTRRQALRSREPLGTCFFLSLILVFSFTSSSITVRAEPVASATSAPAEPRVAPGDMNTGALLLQTEDGTFVEALRLKTDVVMAITGTIARVTVTQRFENKSGRWVAYDGSAGPSATEPAPPVNPAQMPDTVTPVPAAPDPVQTSEEYPVLPLTVVPKPEAIPLTALKAPGDVSQRITLLALLLAVLSAITFILWRHHRRDYASPRRIGRRI